MGVRPIVRRSIHIDTLFYCAAEQRGRCDKQFTATEHTESGADSYSVPLGIPSYCRSVERGTEKSQYTWFLDRHSKLKSLEYKMK
jgi:hypothetical protein